MQPRAASGVHAEMPEGRRRLVHAFLVCALQPLVPGVMLAMFHRQIWRDDALAPAIPLWVPIASAALGAAAIALVVGGLVLRLGRLTAADLGWRRERPLRAVTLGALGAVLATAALPGTAALFGADPREGLQQMLGYTASQRALFVVVGLGLAVAEESLFRGFLQRELDARIGLAGAYVVTAAAFALWHFPWFHLVSVLARFGQGLVYGALRGRDRSLVTPMLAHAACWAFVGLY